METKKQTITIHAPDVTALGAAVALLVAAAGRYRESGKMPPGVTVDLCPVETIEWVTVPCTNPACRGRRHGGQGFTVTVQRERAACAECNECFSR